jgi:aspartate/methionine/tyrosine aminotransferase
VADVCQRAALAAVSGDLSAMSAMRQVFDRRRRLLHRGLNAIPGVSCLEPEGAFYAFPSVAGLLGRPIRGHRPDSSLDLAAVLLDEARVAVVPGEAFGCAGYARLSYALADDQLTEGVRRLADVLGEAQVPGGADS